MKHLDMRILWALSILLMSPQAFAADFTVKKEALSDPKIVFATIESVDVAAARARIGGTIISLEAREGDLVEAGQVIAIVGDEKLALQAKALDAQILGLSAQADKANADLKRVQSLMGSGAVSKSMLDAARAAASGANNDLKSRKAQRDLIEQEVTEGKILAPSAGRVLHVPLMAGSVVMAGETIATIAAESYVLRLSIPERHASLLKKGEKILIESSEMKGTQAKEGEISLVYPAIENGRVMADAQVPDLGNYFVGARVRVWVDTTKRNGFQIPRKAITTKSGIDYVHLRSKDGKIYEIPVQTGGTGASEDEEKIEILSGIKDGDILVMPE